MRIEDLHFAYPGSTALFAGWSAEIAPGVSFLFGDTGSGKTTLLRLLAGALAPAGAAPLARGQVFHVDPSTEDFHQQTGHACLAALGAGGQEDAARRTALVEGFGLAPHLDKALYMLSTGSRRKVWLVAALLSKRPLTLLDEPAAALDAGAQRFLWQAIAQAGREPGRAIVVASSDPDTALAWDHRIDLPPRG